MNDFETELTALLDDAASGIRPRPNFEAARSGAVTVLANGAGDHRFRRGLGVAAVTVALLGGGVAAYQVADPDPSSVVTATETTNRESSEPTTTVPRNEVKPDEPNSPVVVPVADKTDEVDEPTVEVIDRRAKPTAELGGSEFEHGLMFQKIFGTASPGEMVFARSEFGSQKLEVGRNAEWSMILILSEVSPGQIVHIRVLFDGSDALVDFDVKIPGEPKEEPKDEPETQPKGEPKEEPKPEPKEEPEPIGFTAKIGEQFDNENLMKRVFFGTAPVGSVVTASTEWGSKKAETGPEGEWEMQLVLEGVPDDTVVHVNVSANTGGDTFQFEMARAKPLPEPDPDPVEFTAHLGAADLGGTPMKQGFYGTGTPGSAVVAESEFGRQETEVGPNGEWDVHLKMFEVPPGRTVRVVVVNTASEGQFVFELLRPREPLPIEFQAHIALEEMNGENPVNEYWGTANPGAIIVISSPYGGTQVTANGEGGWDARIEYLESPFGQPFTVTLTSSLNEAIKQVQIVRAD